MSANDTQVGGMHYNNSGYPHWDWTIAVGAGYLDGCSTAYVARWRNKGTPIEDLKKSLHFLNKLEENAVAQRPRRLMTEQELVREVNAFAEANKFSDLERAYMRCLGTWQTVDDLNAARQILFLLMDEAEALERGADPVPLTEENHHSPRVGQE